MARRCVCSRALRHVGRDAEDSARTKLAAAAVWSSSGRRVSGGDTKSRDLLVERTGIEPVTSGLQNRDPAGDVLTTNDDERG
jgi:hypothetical protein